MFGSDGGHLPQSSGRPLKEHRHAASWDLCPSRCFGSRKLPWRVAALSAWQHMDCRVRTGDVYLRLRSFFQGEVKHIGYYADDGTPLRHGYRRC